MHTEEAVRRQAGARALSLALDRYEARKLSKITIVKDVSGIQVPGRPYATPPARVEKLAATARHQRNRARPSPSSVRPGSPTAFSFNVQERGSRIPTSRSRSVVDQWRRSGST